MELVHVPFAAAGDAGPLASTLGNRNDVAATIPLLVGMSLTFVRPTSDVKFRPAAGVCAIITATAIATASRSGTLGALVFDAILLLPFARRVRPRLRAQHAVVILAACLVSGTGMLIAASASGLASRLTDSLEHPFSGPDRLDSRWEIWRGVVPSILAHPLTGSGPDGLLVDFPRHRPADLGSPFDRASGTGADPLLVSPHNALLESLSTHGVVGAAVLIFMGIGVVSAWRKAKSLHTDLNLRPLTAGALAMACVAAVNPISISAMVEVAIIGGVGWGLSANPLPSAAHGHAPGRCLAAGIAVASLGAWAVGVASIIAIRADANFAASFAASRTSRLTEALSSAHTSVTLWPLEQTYRRQEVRARVAVAEDRNDLSVARLALDEQRAILDWFPGLATDYVTLAYLLARTGEPGFQEALYSAHEASPFGYDTRVAIDIVTTIAGYPDVQIGVTRTLQR